MKATQTPLFTTKNISKDVKIQSHILLLKAGYIQQQSAGLYTYLPFGWQVHQKIENIIRTTMNNFGAVEVHLPILTTSSLWEISQRWESMGKEMMCLQDRHQQSFCLAPTHEEAITSLAKSYLKSYKQLPINLYQIGTKYRDEIRPRYGLMRSREFVMKDAYSFHEDLESLDTEYVNMSKCYQTIFKQCGLDTILIEADSGNMGGSQSQEFVVISNVGEEVLLLSENLDQCNYKCSQDKAPCIPKVPYPLLLNAESPKDVHTPDLKTVGEVASFLKIPIQQFIKCIILENDTHILVNFIPGDRELNFSKLQNISGLSNFSMCTQKEVFDSLNTTPGFTGPYLLTPPKKFNNKNISIYFDSHLQGRGSLVAGGNKVDYHTLNLQEGRDFTISKNQVFDIVLAKEGDLCPDNKALKLVEKKVIELGHIFKLGQKYTSNLSLEVLNKQGKPLHPIMGCYGIGVGRTMQTIVEQHADFKGVIWPTSITPYLVYLISLPKTEEEKQQSEEIYHQLRKSSITVYFDNRDERPGVKFHDAELVGFPWIIVLGKSFFQTKQLEVKNRKTGDEYKYSITETINFFECVCEESA